MTVAIFGVIVSVALVGCQTTAKTEKTMPMTQQEKDSMMTQGGMRMMHHGSGTPMKMEMMSMGASGPGPATQASTQPAAVTPPAQTSPADHAAHHGG